MFATLYVNDDSSEVLKIFGRLQQELGEMAEAIRLIPISHSYFMNEAADVFAWIMRLANFDEMARRHDEKRRSAFTLEDAMWDEYPGACRYCRSKPCKCPPILLTGLGRISREVPPFAFGEGKSTVLTFEEKVEMFRLSERSISIEAVPHPVTLQLLQQFSQENLELRNYLRQIGERVGQSPDVIEKLDNVLEYLANIVGQQELTVQLVENVLEEVTPDGKKVFGQFLTDFINNVSTNLWAEFLLQLIQHGI